MQARLPQIGHATVPVSENVSESMWHVVRCASQPLGSQDVNMALALLRGFIEHAEDASLRGMRLAVAATAVAP